MSPGRSPTRRAGAYGAVLAAALCCYAALGAVLSILPAYGPDVLGGGATAIGLCVGAPALTGVLALARVPVEHQGAAAGTFFAWFDLGVGLGGPAVGAVAALAGPAAALPAAAGAEALVCAPAAATARRSAAGATP